VNKNLSIVVEITSSELIKKFNYIILIILLKIILRERERERERLK